MNKNTKIASAIVVLIIILVLVLSLSVGKRDPVVGEESNATSTLTSTTELPSTATSSIVLAPKPQILQDDPYVNRDAKFAVFLPKGWAVQDAATSSTASNTWFYDAALEGDAEVTYFIGKFQRDAKMDLTVGTNGSDGFLDLIAKGIADDLNQYALISTTTVMIKGVKFQKYISTYVGAKSGKKANQYKYLALTDKAYYVIGIDAYEEVWSANKDKLMASVSTFEFLP